MYLILLNFFEKLIELKKNCIPVLREIVTVTCQLVLTKILINNVGTRQ